MKALRLAVLCLVPLFASRLAEAQDVSQGAGTPQPHPSPPLLAPQLPAWCKWTVDYNYSATTPQGGSTADRLAAYKKAAQQDSMLAKMMTSPQFLYSLQEPRPLHTIVVKTGDIREDVRNLERGFVDDLWRIGDVAVEKKPDGEPLNVIIVGSGSNDEFSEFSWISTGNFTGRKKLNGIDCLIFKDKIDPMRISHPDLPPDGIAPFIEVTAYVADQTRLPVILQTPTEERRYTFLGAPAAQLIPPAAYAAAAQDAKARVNASSRPLSPP